MKKIFTLLFIFAFIFSCTSCVAQSSDTVLTIGDAEISRDLFTYFAIKAKQNNSELKTIEQLSSAAIRSATEYVAVNSEYKNLKISALSSIQKENIADDVSGEWHIFSEFYKEMGISRTDLTKVRTGEEYRSALLVSLYDTGGKYAVSEDKIKKYFYSNYIAFKAIVGYLTKADEDGTTQKLSEKEIEEMKNEFSLMAQSISAGEDIADVNADYNSRHDITTSVPETTIFKKGGSFYPDNFFESVKKLKYGIPGVIYSEEYIFLVIPVDMSKNEKLYYREYRTECLKSMMEQDFEEYVIKISSQYEIKSVKASVEECCKAVVERI